MGTVSVLYTADLPRHERVDTCSGVVAVKYLIEQRSCGRGDC